MGRLVRSVLPDSKIEPPLGKGEAVNTEAPDNSTAEDTNKESVNTSESKPMTLEAYRSALQLLETCMNELKIRTQIGAEDKDISSLTLSQAQTGTNPVESSINEEGPTLQAAKNALVEPLETLEVDDEDQRDEPFSVALARHLNRLIKLEQKSKKPDVKRLIELTALSDYNNLQQLYIDTGKKSPGVLASNRVTEAKFTLTIQRPVYQYESWYACQLRAKSNHLVRFGSLPETHQGKGATHYSLLSEEDVRRSILSYIRTLKTGQVSNKEMISRILT
jgi:hypothetical protein